MAVICGRTASSGRAIVQLRPYLEVDRRGNLISVNAGHPSPFIYSPESDSYRELPSTGPLLGLPLETDAIYHREFERLEDGKRTK